MKSKNRDFQIQHKLGSGSYGVIFKAKNRTDNTICVLKQINLARLNEKGKRNALNQATILGKLKHPFIVKYIDSFVENNHLNIIMQFCDGGDLSLFLKQQAKKPLKQQKIWKLFLQICMGLEYIHKHKILHRDIKTLNVFLNKNEDVKIGDLGVAKMLQGGDFAQTVVGTPFYLSPQLCEEKPYNQKSDVWALGCLLYQLCTYRHPFEATNQASLILKIIRGKYSPIPQFYSKQLKQVIDLCLQRDYKRRPTAQMILQRSKIKEMISEYKFQEKISQMAKQKIVIQNIANQQAKKQDIKEKQNKNKQIPQQPSEKEQFKKPIPIIKQETDNKIKKQDEQKRQEQKRQEQKRQEQKRQEQKRQEQKRQEQKRQEQKRQEQRKAELAKIQLAKQQQSQRQLQKQLRQEDKKTPALITNRKSSQPIPKKLQQAKQIEVKQHLLQQLQKVPKKEEISNQIRKSQQRLQSKLQFINNLEKKIKEDEIKIKKQAVYYEIPVKGTPNIQPAQIKQIKKLDIFSQPPLPPKQIVTKVKVQKIIQPRVYESNKNINKSKGVIKSGGFSIQEEPKKEKQKQQNKNVDHIMQRRPSFNLQKQTDKKDSSRVIIHPIPPNQSQKNISKQLLQQQPQGNVYKYNQRPSVKKINNQLPPRVRKGSKNQLSRNAQNARNSTTTSITRQEKEQVMNLPDVVKTGQRQQSQSDEQTVKSSNSQWKNINMNKKFKIKQINDEKILEKYQEILRSRNMENNDNSDDSQDDSLEKESQHYQVNREVEQKQIKKNKCLQNMDEQIQQNYAPQQYQQDEEEAQEVQDSGQNQNYQDIYEINRFELSHERNNEDREEIVDQTDRQTQLVEGQQFKVNESDLQWSFDQQPQLPFLQQTETPGVFQQANPYLIEQKHQQQTQQDKKNYLQLKLQENLKREDEINKLMQLKINQCRALVPNNFDEILHFFRQKINMDQQYTQKDEMEVQNFLKKRGLTDHRKFQNIYKIMHFEMELENTRKIIQRICKRLNELQN